MSFIADKLMAAGLAGWADEVNDLEQKHFEHVALLLWASKDREIIVYDRLVVTLPPTDNLSLVEHRDEYKKRTIYSLEVRK